MRPPKKPGYALLFVLLIVSALMLYCVALFRSSFYLLTIPFLQAETVRHEYLIQGLLEYGIAFCVENKNKLFVADTIQRDIILSAKRWPPVGDRGVSGILTIQPVAQNICKLDAQLFSNGSPVSSASCYVTRYKNEADDDTMRITNWNCCIQ